MTEVAMVRGHVLAHAARFIRASYDVETTARVEQALTAEVKQVLDTLAPAGWYDRKYFVELLAAIATVRGRGDAAYGDFVRCGASLATSGNDFTRLLLGVLTPELFVRKLPRFWERDHKGGRCVVERADDLRPTQARLKLVDVEMFDHCAVLWLGFVQGTLDRIGGGTPLARQTGWSWATPGPSEIVYEVNWS